MKAMMWALFTTKHGKTPRHIFERSKDAYRELNRLKKIGIDWGFVERVMIEFEERGFYTIYHHEYRKI